jgi:hypothetical protein
MPLKTKNNVRGAVKFSRIGHETMRTVVRMVGNAHNRGVLKHGVDNQRG